MKNWITGLETQGFKS